MPWFDAGTPGGQSQTEWQAFTRQCGAGDLRRPSPTRKLDQPYGLIGSDLLTPQIIDDHVSALAGKRQSNRATCPVRRQTAGGMARPIARANTCRSALYARLSLPELPATDWYPIVINLLIETDRVQLLAGDQQPVEAPSRRRQHAADLPMSNLSGGGLHPVRTPRTAARPWRHARPAPRAWGRPLEGVLWFFPRRRLPPQVRGTFRGQCVQRLARCRKSCAVVSATSPEALRGRWHCLASDSSRES
jgi:hypothetical protein